MTKVKGLILILSVLLLNACSIKYSFTGASIPPGTETVSVAQFPNMASLVNPLLSYTLEEELKDKFISLTSLQMVPTQGDLQFEGSIVQYRTQPISVQAGSDVAAQNRLTIGIKVKFTNTKDPDASFDTSFSRFADYDSSRSLEEVESALVEEIVEQLVNDIFNKSVVNW